MKFTTAEIISCALGRLVCPMDEVYKVLSFMTGDNLFTHQLPRAFHASKEWMIQQHPWLLELDESTCNRDNYREWLANAERLFGTEHELQPLPPGAWRHCGPIAEAVELMEDKSKVIVVEIPEKENPGGLD